MYVCERERKRDREREKKNANVCVCVCVCVCVSAHALDVIINISNAITVPSSSPPPSSGFKATTFIHVSLQVSLRKKFSSVGIFVASEALRVYQYLRCCFCGFYCVSFIIDPMAKGD